MLGAVDLRRLAEHGAAAVAHQQIDRGAERRIGRDARIAVGAAALQRQGDVARRQGLARDLVGFGQHRLDARHALAHGLGGAAGVLDGEGMQPRAGLEPFGLEQAVDLVGFAAEPEHQHAGEVGMARVARDGAAQGVHRLAFARHAAAVPVHQRDHAVDVGEVGERAAAEMIGDVARRGRRAVHRGQDADEVARRDAAVGAPYALEGRALGLGHERGRLGGGAEGVVAIEIAHRAVVHVNVVARLHGLGREADDLVVLAQRLVERDRRDRDFVAGRDVGAADHVGARQAGAGQQVGARHHDIVGRVQSDGQRSGRLARRHAILPVGRPRGRAQARQKAYRAADSSGRASR